MPSLFAHFQTFFQHYGLLAVLAVLLLENFGLPVPGELALVYAGYHVRVYGSFGLLELILLGTAACVAGQAVGYGVGRYARGTAESLLPRGRRARFEAYFARHGAATILFARFVAGLRVFAGLLAGLGHMPWRPFLAYSALGAAAWVTAMAELGAALGAHWAVMVRLLGRTEIALLVAAAILILWAWRTLKA